MKTTNFFIAWAFIALLFTSCGGAGGGKAVSWPADIEYVQPNTTYTQAGKIVKIEQPDPAKNYDVPSTIVYVAGATLDGVNAYIAQIIEAGYISYQVGGATSVEMPDKDAWMPANWQGKKDDIIIRINLFGSDTDSDGTEYNLRIIFFDNK